MSRRHGGINGWVELALNLPWHVSNGLGLLPSADGREYSLAAISLLSWKDFESLVGAGFRRRGFEVSERGLALSNDGVDLVLKRNDARHLVQCRQWRAQPIGMHSLRALHGAIEAEKAAGGYVVTSGRFTREARIFAEGRHVELIDARNLTDLVHS